MLKLQVRLAYLMATKWIAVVAATVLTASCAVPVSTDPVIQFDSTLTPAQFQDCILENLDADSLGQVKVLPFKGGSLITSDNGIIAPNVYATIQIIPTATGSRVEGRGQFGVQHNAERLVAPCRTRPKSPFK